MTFDNIFSLSGLKSLLYVFTCIIFMLIITSCSQEKKLAKQFIEKKNTVSVLFMKPDVIFKTNYKVKAISSFDSLPPLVKDSVWHANTLFIDSIVDSVYIHKFMNYFTSRSRLYGIKTYTQDSMAAFLAKDGIKFIVNFAQCEIEEYLDLKTFEFAFEVEGRNTNREFLINSVNLNNWFDISMLNTSHSKDMVFSSQTVSDVMEGKYIYYYLSGDVDFEYNYYPMSALDVINSAEGSGEINAGYLFDYLMNTYIAVNLKDKQPSVYYHYKGYKRKVKETKDGFIPLN